MAWKSIGKGEILGSAEASQTFEVVEYLGGGQFGEVFKVRNQLIGTLSAMKTLRRDYESDKEMIAHFLEEGRLWCEIGRASCRERV